MRFCRSSISLKGFHRFSQRVRLLIYFLLWADWFSLVLELSALVFAQGLGRIAWTRVDHRRLYE